MPATQHAGEVAPGLFVGDLASLDHLQELGITHVVTVLNDPGSLLHAGLAGLERHCVDVEDSEHANLLQRLPAAMAFVRAALGGGGRVLVHCAQGASRSAAVAAAWLMAASPAPAPAPAAALATLRARWPPAAPNPGFLHQLELWHAMGCRLADGHLPYKQFLLAQAALRYAETGRLDVAALPQPHEAPAAGAGASSSEAAPTLYRCRKCRGLVATEHNMVDVEEGPGAAAFRWRKRDKQQRQSPGGGGGGGGGGEGSVFVEPLRWMCEGGGGESADDGVAGGVVQGKLYCPKCGARLGSFNWAGSQSSSGAWVTPAFQLHLAKLDAVQPPAPAALAASRQPRLLQAAAPAAAAPQQQVPAGASGAAERGALAGDAAVGSAAAQLSAAAPRRFTYLILDCDGVLVDSERASCEALRRAILQVTGCDIPHAFPADFRPVFGMDVRGCVEYYQRRLDGYGWGDAAEVAAAVEAAKGPLYAQLTAGGIAAFPGVGRLVAQARALSMGVAVASSGAPAKIAHNLASSGLAPLFPDPHLVVSAQHVARGKPAPDVYVEALRRLGCTEPGRAVVVEDAVNGLAAAAAAGCFTVAVATSLPADVLAPHADLVLPGLADLDLAALQAACGGGTAGGSAA